MRLLTPLLLATSAFAAWGDGCNYFSGANHGVCVNTNECPSSGAKIDNGLCPNDPANVKCCTAWGNGCNWIQNGRCEGPENIKYVPFYDSCWETVTGKCPGGPNYRSLVRWTSYKKLW